MIKPHVGKKVLIFGLLLWKEKNEKLHRFESLQSAHTPSMPKRHPKFGILATVYCRVNITLENSHQWHNNKNYFKYFKYA